jgi:hypothetical protein
LIDFELLRRSIIIATILGGVNVHANTHFFRFPLFRLTRNIAGRLTDLTSCTIDDLLIDLLSGL